jgi:hypothetical protein
LLPPPFARRYLFGTLLATGLIESTGKSSIGGLHRQMQYHRRAGHLRQIRETLPALTDRYNRQPYAIEIARDQANDCEALVELNRFTPLLLQFFQTQVE